MLTYLKGKRLLHVNTQSHSKQIVLHVETVCWLTFGTRPTLADLNDWACTSSQRKLIVNLGKRPYALNISKMNT